MNYKNEVKTLLNALQSASFALVGVDDGGEFIRTSDKTEALEAILSVDMSRLYVVNSQGKKDVLLIVIGNSPGELVADHSTRSDDIEAVISHHADAHERII